MTTKFRRDFSRPRSIPTTGASSGLVAALARAYAAPGVTLALGGRDPSRLEAVARACRDAGAAAHEAVVDVLDKPALALFPPAASTVKEPRWFSSQAFLRFVNVVEAPPSMVPA